MVGDACGMERVRKEGRKEREEEGKKRRERGRMRGKATPHSAG